MPALVGQSRHSRDVVIIRMPPLILKNLPTETLDVTIRQAVQGEEKKGNPISTYGREECFVHAEARETAEMKIPESGVCQGDLGNATLLRPFVVFELATRAIYTWSVTARAKYLDQYCLYYVYQYIVYIMSINIFLMYLFVHIF